MRSRRKKQSDDFVERALIQTIRAGVPVNRAARRVEGKECRQWVEDAINSLEPAARDRVLAELAERHPDPGTRVLLRQRLLPENGPRNGPSDPTAIHRAARLQAWGYSINEAAKIAGVPRGTLQDWQEMPAYQRAFADADFEAVLAIRQFLTRFAEYVGMDPTLPDGPPAPELRRRLHSLLQADAAPTPPKPKPRKAR
jgi:hypothetical protein